MYDILMPQVAKATGVLTLNRWLKSSGQPVSKGDIIAQVESSYGLVDLESAKSGILKEIILPASKSCPPGTVIARLEENAAAGRQVEKKPAPASVTSASSVPIPSAVTPLLMPAAGNSMEEGTIVKWRVKVGDRIKKGDIIYEVETDKATLEVEATEEGRLAKIVTPEGGVQKVKQPVAYLSEGEVADIEAAQPATPASASQSSSVSSGVNPSDATPILMPAAGNSMEEGTIVKWRVAIGDRIKKGQIIFEVETDKATMEVEATEEGRLAAILIPEGAVQKVKEPVAYLSENDVTIGSQRHEGTKARRHEVVKEVEGKSAAAVAATASAPFVPAISAEGRLKASPAARKIAAEKGLNLASVSAGSGPGGRILSTDLLRAKPAASAGGILPPKADASVCPPVQSLATTQLTRKKMSKMRRAIAANLQQSKQTIPHFYLRTTVSADAMMAFYKGEKAKYPCSINDVVTLACAKAIIEFPAFHSKIDGDEIVEYPSVNIGVAVGVEDGLTVPVILGAHAMNLEQIAANTRRVVDSARSGKLEGYGQGNFTITNLGMFGVEEFAAIVNPPEPAILAVGAAREAVIVKDGFMKPGRVMTMTLSCDHRIIDGLLAAKFMARLKQLLENPGVLA